MKALQIEKRQLERLHILYRVYCHSTTKAVDVNDIAFSIGIKNGAFEAAFNYLDGEGWVTQEGNKSYNCKISHAGIRVIENAILNPTEKSEYFPPFNDLDIKE